MELGLQTGYWSSGPPAGVEEQIAEAERLGFTSVWTAEAYGSDALTPLAWWGSRTSTVRLGTAVCQLSARTPAATAMAALTLDHLSGGRFVLGLGVSGPQVVEGWYGQPYERPLERTREHIEVIRAIWAREAPVQHDGPQVQVPYRGPGSTGLGKPLKSTVHPLRRDIPIFLGAEGPKNVALAGEVADGWLPLFLSPSTDAEHRARLAEGFSRPGARHRALKSDGGTFEVAATVPVVIGDDVERAADAIRPMLALYIGGMGARGRNFHFDVFARMGYEAEAGTIQDLYLAGRKAEAVAAVPLALVDEVALVGPVERIRDGLEAWRSTCVSTLLVGGPPPVLRRLAELVASG